MQPILISLSPNTEKDDVLLAWKMLLKPGLWHDGSVAQRVESVLSGYFGGCGVVAVSSGRVAIFRTLQAYGIGSGDEVIIQAFTCLAVAAPIKWCGAEPVYADINPRDYNFDVRDVQNKITSHTKAIIVQHTFGIPGPVNEIIDIARKNNIVVIEDLAHGLGAKAQGQVLGTFGDVAILSFGRDKTISCIFGGAVVSRDRDLIKKIRQQQEQLKFPPGWWVAQQLFHPLAMSVIIPYYYQYKAGKVLLVAAQKRRLLSLAVTAKEKIGRQPSFVQWRCSPVLLFLLENQLKKLDRFLTKRRRIARQYAEALTPGLWTNELLANAGWIRFPMKMPKARKALKLAREHQIMLGDWYAQPIMPALAGREDITGYAPGSCPAAEEASRTTVNLPTHINMSDEDVDRVIEFIRKVEND